MSWTTAPGRAAGARFGLRARLPEHKIRIVEARSAKDALFPMTGDGVNDAPALKAADIGVAMGITGTEVSKDAASMILADDNFATIVGAVVNGRSVYTNIKNAINFLLSGNMAGILCVLFTSILALPVPFAPVHLLFINLLTDSLPAIAIGVEPASGDLLDQKPRDLGNRSSPATCCCASFFTVRSSPAPLWPRISSACAPAATALP